MMLICLLISLICYFIYHLCLFFMTRPSPVVSLTVTLFPSPTLFRSSNPRNLSPSRLALYFDYGRSMEGRLRRATRSDPDATAPITLAGWYEPLTARSEEHTSELQSLMRNSYVVFC